MRELKTNDVFRMSRILKKMDLKSDLDVVGKTQEQVGAEFILSIGQNLHKAQKEVNAFMGDLIGMTGEEFGELTISETLKYFEEFKSMPGINDFFKLAGQLTESKS